MRYINFTLHGGSTLISLQDDKDLVHEFVNSDGLNALITVGTDADQNYQNYILRGNTYLPVQKLLVGRVCS